MEFENGRYCFKITSINSLHFSHWNVVSSLNRTSLARYLIQKGKNNPVFEDQLERFCPKPVPETLGNPYPYDESENEYLSALTFQLMACDVLYREKGAEYCAIGSETWSNISFIPPWEAGGGGISSTKQQTNATEINTYDDNDPVQQHMDYMRRISRHNSTYKYHFSTANFSQGSSSSLSTQKQPETEWLELNLYYADLHKTPISSQAFDLTLADGSEMCEQRVNEKGYTRLESLPKGKTEIQTRQDPSQQSKLRQLHTQLEATLNQLVEQAAEDSKHSDHALKDSKPLEEGLVYVGAFMMGGYDMVTDLWAFAKIVGQGLVKLEMAYLDILQDLFTGNVNNIQRKLEQAAKSGQGAYQAASESAEAIYLLSTDADTWEILTNFVEDYWDASNGVDLTRNSAPLVIEIVITILTAGAATPTLAANLGKATKLTEKAVDIVRQIVKARKELGPKVIKQSRTAKREMLEVDYKLNTDKDVTPDWNKAINLNKKPRDLSNPLLRTALFRHYGIEIDTYKELKKIKKAGYQREHFLPHSNFMTRSKQAGEARSNVPIGEEFGSYSEDDAITYFVYDAQKAGTEHRYLTDVEKNYARQLEARGEHATVTQWLDHMEAETAKSLPLETIERADGEFVGRIPDDDATDIAKAIRIEYEAQLDRMGVNKNARMSNLVGGGSVPGTGAIETVDDF